MNLNIDFVLLDHISSVMVNKGLTVSVAESCTGGFLSTFFTSKSGASKFFNGSVTSYSSESKTKLLRLNQDVIDHYGVASKQVAHAMASSVRVKFGTDYGLSTTGYVDKSNDILKDEKNHLYAWIAIANKDRVISDCIFLQKNRLQNISHVSYELLNLFRKEIA
tara:strand:- start:122 stop:613 length:492 start_codon:yes stop_codon:yes gene_type:complete